MSRQPSARLGLARAAKISRGPRSDCRQDMFITGLTVLPATRALLIEKRRNSRPIVPVASPLASASPLLAHGGSNESGYSTGSDGDARIRSWLSKARMTSPNATLES